MEFYFAKMLWLYLQIPVSIPNGMEFYQKAQAKRSAARFNSQRDGILLIYLRTSKSSSGFQFPTGWNSTCVRSHNRFVSCSFQFPTGWNSTHFKGVWKQRVDSCFNSQRDGILRDSLRWWRRNSCFNSQRDGILPDVPMFASDNPIRFNSQRDGILRVMRCLKVQRITVSIPNGMEFYYAIFRINVRQRRVSIPNGMEFYWNRLHQKDHWQTLFQFPTGWNSTLAVFK